MSKYLIEQETLSGIADAIREKTGGTDEIRAEDFAAEISDIETGGDIPPEYVIPTGTKLITQNVTGEDVTNYAAVDVAVPGPSGTKQINITANGTTTEDVTDYADAEIIVNVPAGVMPSEFFPIKKTTVTVGENTVSTILDFVRYINGLAPSDTDPVCVSMHARKASYAANEVMLARFYWHDPTYQQTTTYWGIWKERDDHAFAQVCNIGNANFSAVVLAGTQYDIYYVPHILKIEDRFPEA